MGLMRRHVQRPERTEKGGVIAVIMFALVFVGWVGEWPLELDSVMYHGLWRSPFVVFGPMFVPIPGIRLFLWQILLIGLVPFCAGAAGTTRQHAREMDRAILVSVACIAVTCLWGLLRGGSAYFAYFQVWRFLAALLITYVLMSALRSERDLVTLGKIVVVAALIRAILCIYFFWTPIYARIHDTTNYVTNHDDSMLFVVAILILTTWAVLKGGRTSWTIAAPIMAVLLYAMVANNRRIAWVEMGWAMPLIYLLIGPGPLRSRINRWAMIAAPVVLIYVVVGMGSDNPAFAPVHALMTTGSNQDSSSLTRKEEIRNLLRTLVDFGNPLFGTGWGVPYSKVESIYSNYDPRWILYLYTPHNSVLGLAAFAGLVGIIGIWGVVPVGAYLATRGYRGSTGVVPRCATMVALCALAVYSAHCYGDIGLQSLPGAIILGAALATAGKVAVWSEALPLPETATARAAGGKQAPELRPVFRNSGTTRHRFESPAPGARPSDGNDVPAKPDRKPGRRLPH